MHSVIKKILMLTLILLMAIEQVSALSLDNNTINYKNNNGVVLSKKEYDFVNKFYGYSFFYDMTEEDYEWIKDLDVNNRNVTIVNLDNYNDESSIGLKGTSHATESKKLIIAKTCDTRACYINVNLTWKVNPGVRSYDVMGIRTNNTSFYANSISTKISSSSGTYYSNDNTIYHNGFGTTFKLPSSGSNIRIEQKFTSSPSGTIFASYQHAQSDIPIATSKQFTISAQGVGKVFDFYGNAVGKYDNMRGVDINL